MPFIHYVLDTVKYSWKNKELISCYQKGADFGRGLSSDINVSEYYYSINRFIKDYLEWQYEPESVLLLEKIINKLKNNNVEVIVFFNPMTIDLLLALDITGKIENFYYIKKKVAEFTSYYDFNYANSITENRNNFYDASHYNMKTGNIILALCIYTLCANLLPDVLVDSFTGEKITIEQQPCGICLSKREKEILKQIAKGKMSKEIADCFSISIHTVSRHRQNILKKLQVDNSIQALEVAKELHLI